MTTLAIARRRGGHFGFALVFLALFVVSALPAVAQASLPDGEARGTITRVMVHPDSAVIHRERVLEVKPGPLAVRFAHLPEGTDSDSLRVRVAGPATRFVSVEIERVVHEAMLSPVCQTAHDELAALTAELNALEAEANRAQALASYLGESADAAATLAAQRVGTDAQDLASLGELLDYVSAQETQLLEGKLERSRKRRAIREKTALAKARCPQGVLGRVESRTGVVELEVAQAGTLRVELAYETENAGWTPSYMARLDEGSGKVEFDYEANIWQESSEDWRDVALEVSTSDPEREAAQPWLRASRLSVLRLSSDVAELPIQSRRVDDIAFNAPNFATQSALPQASGDGAPGVSESAGYASGASPAAIEQAAASGRFATVFSLPDRATIASGGGEERVVLRTITLETQLLHLASPSMSPDVWVGGRVRLPVDLGLLAGKVRLSAHGALIGEEQLAASPPGGIVKLPFGTDPRVSLQRTLLPSAAGKQGVVRRKHVVRRAFRTVLENHNTESVTISLIEAVPVPQDSRIEVELDEATTRGTTDIEGRPNILNWEFELAPGESRTFHFGYVVRYPVGLELTGL